MAIFRLPELSLELPVIATPECAALFESLAEQLERHCRNIGKNSGAYRVRREKLRRVGLAGNDIAAVIDGPGYIRPLLELWTKERAFLEKAPPNPRILGIINRILGVTARNRIGRLALRETCQLFFTRYDMLGDGLAPLCKFLRRQLKKFHKNELMFGLDRLIDNVDCIVSLNGHKWLANQAASTSRTLPDEADQNGIPVTSSRFFEVSQNIFYLKRIEGLKPNQSDDILFEVRAVKVHSAPYEDGHMLGHSIVIALIDKLSGCNEEPTNLWLKTILAIAGDPRIPSSHRNYLKWWSHFGHKRINQMRRWLSKMDMGLFLDIVKEFSERKGGEDMRRMFPKRKRFLEGLFEKKLVQDAQLFLSSQPEEYLRSRFGKDEQLPYFARLTGTNNKLTIFYFRMGDVCLVEGTHSFALTIMDKLPDKCPAGKYEERYIDARSLGVGLQESYFEQFRSTEKFARIIHKRNWIENAYNQLKLLGVPISPGDIMESEDYERMIAIWR